VAWDTEGTKRQLLEAGTRQFAQHGFAGARMDAIARDAGVNKERVYRYFGDKEGLFSAVLESQLAGLFDGLEVVGESPAAVGEFAGAMFDRCCERPELPRLLAWESLELGQAVAVAERRPYCGANVSGIGAALGRLGSAGAEQLLFGVVSLVAGWWTLGCAAEVILGETSVAQRRADLVAQATAMASAMTSESAGQG